MVQDSFVGITDRLVLTARDVLIVRIGLANHLTRLAAHGSGDAVLTPEGWQQNWFSRIDVSGSREMVSINWERAGLSAAGTHLLSIDARLHHRSMQGTVADQTIRITDSAGRLARLVEFGPAGDLVTAETYEGTGVRDLWDPGKRLQIDAGVRLDGGASASRVVPGPRLGVRYFLDDAGRTTIRGSIGRFVGRLPLGARVFDRFPDRTDTTFDLATGSAVDSRSYHMSQAPLPLPRADAVALELEHRFSATLEVQAAVRQRLGSRLATVHLPGRSGAVLLSGTGESRYRELQVSARKTWSNESQVFVSYVHSSSLGDVNDFGSLFTNLDAPLLEPGGLAPIRADVPHRLRGWSTFSLPRRAVVSPSVEWRTGFPYSPVDLFQHYAGPANSQRFPRYFSTDVTAFKTFDLFARKADLGLQFFNVTGHFNPRDVIYVVDSLRYRQFSSSFGVTLAGYMQIRW
jgi:hypothetical protein